MRFLAVIFGFVAALLATAAGAQTPNANLLRMNGGVHPAYLGLVATRGTVESSSYSGWYYIQTRTSHFARTGFSQAKIILGNISEATDTGPGAASIDTCSIEYPSGVFNQCKFSGSTSVSIPSGGITVSDWITLSSPIPNGAQFWVRIWHNISNGNIYLNAGTSSLDRTTFSATSIPDQTLGGTVTQTNSGLDFFPIGIVGKTASPSLCLMGDSRVSGNTTDTPDSTGFIGELARSIGPSFAFMNLGSSGTGTTGTIVAHANLVALGAYCSHFIANWSINDIVSGISAAQELANNQTIRAYFPSTKPYYLTTIAPYTTSTDSWATLVNQTVSTHETARVSYNTLLRSGGIAGIAGVFDTELVTESSFNSGYWVVNGSAYYYTGPGGAGLHENATSYIAIKTSSAIPTSAFHYP